MKGLWKQSGLAGLACADVGSLNPLGAAAGRSRRRTRLVVYGFAIAFAAFTAYVAFSSPLAGAGEGGASWFGGVYASTEPYRAQVYSLFLSIFPTNSSIPSLVPPRRDGGSSKVGGEVASVGIDEQVQVGSGLGNSSSASAAGFTKQSRSGGSAPSNNAGGGSAPAPGSLAGIGTPAAKGNSSNGGGAPANNSATSGGAPANSAVDRSSPTGDGSGSPTTTSSSAEKGSSAKSGEENVDKSNKQSGNGSGSGSGSEAPSNEDVVSDGKGSMTKADTKVAIGAPSDNSAGINSSTKADSRTGSNNNAGSGNGAETSVFAASNNTAVKSDTKHEVFATSTDSARSGSDVKADLNIGSDAHPGSGNGDANHTSDATVSPAKGNAKDGGADPNSGSGNVASTYNHTASPTVVGKKEGGSPGKNQTLVASPNLKNHSQTSTEIVSGGSGVTTSKQKESIPQGIVSSSKNDPAQAINSKAVGEVLVKGNGSSMKQASTKQPDKKVDWIKEMASCDLFHGNWVRDDSYPLYLEGSCPHIDEPFDCYRNGRPDRAYQKLRWQPSGCSIPRLNPTDMLERLRGKRLVFIGDSLNRNMWESLVCILRNYVKDKRKVFEASGRREFKTEGSYSFLFTDYNCSVEFFRSPFLVQEWEMKVSNGKKKETLRLDIVEQSSPKYKDADFLIFNTGHWWTHEKTSLGKDYYQEGNHVYSELNVVDAFHKALVTWSKWIDANVNPKKTTVLFRGYSASHFSGGQWNSGGNCDKETEPIRNEQYLSTYPPKMSILEDVIHKMKTPVVYLNITRMTDYRKDAHPSIYRKQSLTEEERRSPERFQDCSHWCLPGVPDSWNELLYAQLLIKQHQMLLQ
ncbi:hypothetical protein ABZP36_020653 [Zizania latifolia]